MAWRLANSLITLKYEIDNAWPDRNKQSDGSIGDAAHAAVASDHNPNSASAVCALDITNDPPYFDAHALADRLLANRHPDLKYLISNKRIAGDWTGWQWVNYTGTSDPHINHIHISVGVGPDGQSQPPYDDTNKWNVKEGDMPVTKQQVINMYNGLLGVNPSAEEVNAYTGKDFVSVYDDIYGFAIKNKRDYMAYRASGSDTSKPVNVEIDGKQYVPKS